MDISENTANLKRLLQDMQHVFSTEELLGIIESQFLDDTVASVDKGIHNKTTKYGLPTY